MKNLLSTEETTVVEVYSSRRDAEIALEYLNDEEMDAFISADDAGGLHPQLQQTHGVKLLMLAGDAEKGREKLRTARLLNVEPEPDSVDAASTQNEKVSWIGNIFLILAAVAIAVILLMSTIA